jgi:hypothetical protein
MLIINRIPVYIVLILCSVTVYTLFNIKNSVMTIRMELNEVNNQIRYERDAIHLLKAELAYLSSPERLHKLNERYLALKETKVSQMIGDPVKGKKEPKILLANSKTKINTTKWRYKKGPSKYVLVSGKSAR